MFRANTNARVRGVHALGLVILFMTGRHPFFLFFSFLLPLKFQFIPTLLEIFHSSVNILLNILCMNIQIFTMLCPGHVKIMKIFVTVTQIMMESNMVFTCHYCLISLKLRSLGEILSWWLCQCAHVLSVADSQVPACALILTGINVFRWNSILEVSMCTSIVCCRISAFLFVHSFSAPSLAVNGGVG